MDDVLVQDFQSPCFVDMLNKTTDSSLVVEFFLLDVLRIAQI